MRLQRLGVASALSGRRRRQKSWACCGVLYLQCFVFIEDHVLMGFVSVVEGHRLPWPCIPGRGEMHPPGADSTGGVVVDFKFDEHLTVI